MMDVLTEIDIAAPRALVAAFVADPGNAPQWYRNIREVVWKTAPPLRVGSKLTFVARFLGRQLRYTYQVVEFTAGERLVMRTAEGPFPMETTYTWHSTAAGTRMSLRNRGTPGGIFRILAPVMGVAVRRENEKGLRALKAIMEKRGATSAGIDAQSRQR